MSQKLPGLNVQAPWARLLLEGDKTIETRTYPLPTKYVGQSLWLIETPGPLGAFRARVIGVIRFSGSKRYQCAESFYQDSDQHLIYPHTKTYAWKPGTPKFGWIVESVWKTSQFAAPKPRGIIYARPFSQKEAT